MASTSIFASTSDEQKWISQISKILDKEVKIKIDIPVSIFRVPKSLSAFKPKAYEPQLIGLGPYHHFQPELYEMERYKLASASRVQKKFKSLEFNQLVEILFALEYDFRACYHKYIDIEGDTLAWIMAIDGLFLLDFLTKFDKQMVEESFTSITAHLVDSSGKKLNHDGILGDVLMLENQIPIFLLSKILSIQCSKPEISNNTLPTILYSFCKSLSPLKLENDLALSQVCYYAHLLDLLYHMIVPKLEDTQDHSYTQGEGDSSSRFVIDTPHKVDPSKSIVVFAKLYTMVANLGFASKLINPIRKIIDKAKNIVTKIPGLQIVLTSIGKNPNPEAKENKLTPKVEEIMIPSVSLLYDAGVIFTPSFGGISTVKFDKDTKTFHLPVLSLDVSSEIVMRNLVAYEASAMSDTLVFSRYVDLMSGIVDTIKDAKLLREKKIILNSLKSDDDVAELFNGMSRSVRLTHVPFIDKAIGDVNKYFYNTPKVRIYMRIKAYVLGSWQVLTILAVILLIFLNGLQSFCAVYNCGNLYSTTNSEQ